ncbi:MAG: hypothetical protein ABIQ02_01965 [Saprospiraceae bacterium]
MRWMSIGWTGLSGRILREYYAKWIPKEDLFEGQNGGKYSERSIAKVAYPPAELSTLTMNKLNFEDSYQETNFCSRVLPSGSPDHYTLTAGMTDSL